MNDYLKFHHFGLAVKRQAQAATFARSMGYQIGQPVFDPEQNVHLAMCTHATEPALELIWPGDGKGPVDGLVQRHTSGIIYHACYETRDLATALKKLEADGVKVICVSPPKPALLFGGRKVSFYNVLGMGLVEILEMK